jgi:hypothetical protein
MQYGLTCAILGPFAYRFIAYMERCVVVWSLRTLLHSKTKGSARVGAVHAQPAEQIQSAQDLVASILQKSTVTLEEEEERGPAKQLLWRRKRMQMPRSLMIVTQSQATRLVSKLLVAYQSKARAQTSLLRTLVLYYPSLLFLQSWWSTYLLALLLASTSQQIYFSARYFA